MMSAFRRLLSVVMFLLPLELSCHSVRGGLGTSPADDSKGVPYDTFLKLTFSGTPKSLGSGGIVVKKLADGSVVDSFLLGGDGFTNSVGGRLFRYEPFSLREHSLLIQLHSGALRPGESYLASVDPGVLLDYEGKPFTEIAGGCSWTFSTREAIQHGKTSLTVAADGSGDFCSIQGAVDYVPDDNSFPIRILVKKGFYDGIVYVGQGKNQLHFVGESREGCVIQGLNNNSLNPTRVGRALFGVDANDISLENFTVKNTTPYKGSQAEAVRINGERCTLKNCNFLSFQDTLLLCGSVYVTNCLVEGDVDFIWGEGKAFFEGCELRALHNGYFLQSRNPLANQGYVFHQCKLSEAPGVEHCLLARIDADRFPNSSVAFIDCTMAPCVPPTGWEIKGTNHVGIHFGEYHSRDLSGGLIDISSRIPGSQQLTREEAEKLADPKTFFAKSGDWIPR